MPPLHAPFVLLCVCAQARCVLPSLCYVRQLAHSASTCILQARCVLPSLCFPVCSISTACSAMCHVLHLPTPITPATPVMFRGLPSDTCVAAHLKSTDLAQFDLCAASRRPTGVERGARCSGCAAWGGTPCPVAAPAAASSAQTGPSVRG